MASIGDGLRFWINRIAGWLYPSGAVCVACGALRVDVAQWQLCGRCAEKLCPLEPPFCPRCGKPGWLFECPDCATRKPDALDGRCAAFPYQDTARGLVRALKYGSVSSAAAVLADGMEKAVPPGRFDVQVPVPLHSMRERQRGFNQARLLSESLSRLTGIPTVDALIRIRATQTQTRLSREDRAENVLGAFQLRMPVEGLSILLVDDVLTTGATAVSCAEALKEAGARGVWLITAALANAGLDG